MNFTLNDRITRCKRIAGHSVWTGAHWGVIYDRAFCVLSANSSAWVEALVTNASFV